MEDIHQNDKTKPNETLTGGFFYYMFKIGMAVFAILFSIAGILIMAGGTYKITSTVPLDREMIALIVILFIFAFNTIL